MNRWGGGSKRLLQAFFKNSKGVFIPIEEKNLNGALIGDVVVLDLKKRKVLNVLKRSSENIVCEVIIKDSVKYLKPLRILGKDYLKLRISEKDMKRLVEGDIISAKLDTLKYDDFYEAYFMERLGHKNDPDIVLNVIASNHGFSLNFSKEALFQVEQLPTEVDEKEIEQRLDLRKEEIFTIDSIYTKDMDDAVSLESLPNGHYKLGVHIADVSHYVPINSPLWKEAVQRGTSLYMINTVVPMFPHKLSNGICSLNEGVDRLTYSCIMELDEFGNILDYQVVPSVIHSQKKMTYENVEKILNGESISEYEKFTDTLNRMNDLALTIQKRRGSLPFNSSDLEYNVGAQNNILDFQLKDQNKAMNIIEQFMVMANTCLSKYSTFVNLATPYRVHEEPSDFKFNEMLEKIVASGYKIDDCLTYDNYQTIYNILNKYRDSVEFPYLSEIVLRTMKKAKYSSYNFGHYALKERYYSHFTSPIRRLPDLLLHYQISTIFNHKYPLGAINDANMEKLCEHASFREQQAELAEKEANQYTLLQYMSRHLDKFYVGFIKEVLEDGIKIVTKEGVCGKILYQDFNSSIMISTTKQALYFKNHLVLKMGNAVLLKVREVDFTRNEVIFMLEKNLSLRPYQEDLSLSLKRNIS